MNIADLCPTPTRRVPFQLRDYQNLQRVSGGYALTTAPGEILYIGKTNNFYRRFQEHLDNNEKTGMTSLGKAIWFYFLEYPEIQIGQLERSWLNQFLAKHAVLPELNKIYASL
ncbi:GIY-YIG nuclease family protein [Desulfovibrio sp. OttesenSCG-928-O18]|nr:GIY-YIG nuclease family protein [Desulfovibrio sp. OttesenSCG-928-O18]